ncbi:hypothetical protein XA68_12683 [Ophiocordyceps unilateralis]|uniref:Uncharacterized protein n=1 Tax=Ophiocordyceps unilateralis TaxID=268505 RepID=A0A2A9PCR0_OPHUN|nr:hypothetical protein XA68_12683 [Ophiocordyceps unilateralis]
MLSSAISKFSLVQSSGGQPEPLEPNGNHGFGTSTPPTLKTEHLPSASRYKRDPRRGQPFPSDIASR